LAKTKRRMEITLQKDLTNEILKDNYLYQEKGNKITLL